VSRAVRLPLYQKHLGTAPDDERRSPAGLLYAVHVIAGLDPAHGGPSYCVPRLCEALAATGAGVTLLSVAKANGAGLDISEKGYRDRRFAWDYTDVPILRGLRSSSGLSGALYNISITADVIHTHGLWLLPNVQAGWAAKRARKPLVISPHGMLDPAALAFSRLKKRAFWTLFQGSAIRDAACIHATSEQEYEEVRRFGLANPVVIIPNGIDFPELVGQPTGRPTAERVVLSLGRIHPKKGLDRLIRAWVNVESKRPGWRLRIIGPSEIGHDNELRALAVTLGLSSVSIEGPIYGDVKHAAYHAADLFVLPTLNENFGLTVAEALAAGTPVIATKGAPWPGLQREECGWWIDHGIESLATSLTQATAMPREALKAMGARGRAWMRRDFSWHRVGQEMLDLYGWLARTMERPSTILFD
jgi:glycosyltransferase involved in cell wall biosynthesis